MSYDKHNVTLREELNMITINNYYKITFSLKEIFVHFNVVCQQFTAVSR